MNNKEIFEQLLPIVKTYLPDDIDVTQINLDSDLTKELNINSAHLVDVVLDVEDAFDVEFTNEDMEQLRTINDTIAIIQKKKNK
ncbi:MAG: acyl carrier protein [Patiriisocius sp.]|jgi:acyl carrier protein